MATTGKDATAALASKMIAGVAKRFAGTSTLGFANSAFTPAQLTTALEAIVNLRAGVLSTRATARTSVDEEKSQLPALLALMSGLEGFVRTTFGDTPQALADFGLLPRKARTPLTAEQLTAAAAKRAATRKARGTKGSIQRKAVKGDVSGVVVTPVVMQPVPQAAPATTAPPPGSANGSAPPRTA